MDMILFIVGQIHAVFLVLLHKAACYMRETGLDQVAVNMMDTAVLSGPVAP
jgi:hypothetical protein